MLSITDLLTVGYTVAGIAAVAAAAGMVVLRLLAARSVATSITVVAGVTVAATLVGVVVISMEMFISGQDRDVVLAVVVIAGIAGLAVALLLGRRVSAASRLMLGAVQEVARGGEYRPPQAVLPAELAGLSAELATAHRLLAESWERERALESSRRELVAWVSHDLRTPLAGLRAMAEALEDGVVTDQLTISRYHAQIGREATGDPHDRRPVRAVPHSRRRTAAVLPARRARRPDQRGADQRRAAGPGQGRAAARLGWFQAAGVRGLSRAGPGPGQPRRQRDPADPVGRHGRDRRR